MMPSISGEDLLDDWFDFPFEHSLLNGRRRTVLASTKKI